MSDAQLFGFEQDFVDSLRCIPMAVRLKLDVCGIKLSLRQWSRLLHADRQALLTRPCRAPAEIAAYRAALTDLIARRAQETAKALAETPCWQWDNPRQLPAAVRDYARAVGLTAPADRQWAALTRLQRFALIKLTRDNHDNVNFVPALREFGLLDARTAASR